MTTTADHSGLDGTHWHQQAAVARVETRPFIAGAFVDSASSECIPSLNPATGAVVAEFPVGCKLDVDRAVAAARTAFNRGDWSRQAPAVRRAALLRLAELIDTRAADIAILDTLQIGKPITQALADAHWAARIFRFYGEAVDKLNNVAVPAGEDFLALTSREPHGVVAAIVAWNFPVVNAAIKLAPALAAGNVVVLKPSEIAAASSLLLAAIGLEAGIPAGVLNVVIGTGAVAGTALAAHADVDMLTFTGSTVTGRKLMELAGHSNLKPVMLECGGKSPHIVLEDCGDLDRVALRIAEDIFRNQGQVCSAGSRLIAPQSKIRPLLERLVHHARQIVPGDPLQPGTTYGPMATSAQFDRVLAHIEDAIADGAELVCGGRSCQVDGRGLYIEPTVFATVDPASRLAREEVFGPVLGATGFHSETDAISIANNSIYGLSATIWTRDFQRGHQVASGLRCGHIAVIDERTRSGGAGMALSSEPVAQSGFGIQGGVQGLYPFTRQRTTQYFLAPGRVGPDRSECEQS